MIHRVMGRVPALALLALLAGARPAGAQQDAMGRAYDLERRGNYAAAVDAYRTVLERRPTDAAALLGLERSLVPLNRPADLVPAARAAMAAGASSAAVYGVALRAYSAAGLVDSLRPIALRWAAIEPKEEGPFREWGSALLGRRDIAGARAAYVEGRAHLGRADALAAELAQLAAQSGDYPAALKEWLLAIRTLPGYRVAAIATLAAAPERERADLLHELDRADEPAARRLGAELRARWGDPLGAYRLLASSLPPERPASIETLRQFLELLRSLNTDASRAAQGMALEALAARLPPAQAARSRLDAAQAYAEAGRHDDARRVLSELAADKNVPPQLAAGAALTLIGVLVDEGKIDEAERRLREAQGGLSVDDYAGLRRRVLLGWVKAGKLARADSAVAGDSTVDGLALAGRVALYRGDLAEARKRFQAAGPFAGSREEATARTALLALIQPIQADTLPALGAALLALEQGDSAAAVGRLDAVARALAPERGGAEIRLLIGQVEARRGHREEAERAFRAADVAEAPGTAPAAELELARLLIGAGRRDAAVQTLEHMILTYPQSALVPQARRELDIARGAVPRT